MLFAFVLIGVAAALSYALGKGMHCVFCPERPNALDRLLTAVLGARAAAGQDGRHYFVSLLLFNAVLVVFTGAVLICTGNLSADLLFNTVVSFVTNTNLQHYPEGAITNFGIVFGLMGLQFASAATGLAVFVQVCRLLAGCGDKGNFYLDAGRALFGVLVPVALAAAVLLALCGVPMSFARGENAALLEGGSRLIELGPLAAFVSIKQLGTNGGGFFCANSAHPFENVSFYSNFLECVLLVLVPMACIWLFGRIVRRPRDAWVIFGVLLLFLAVKTALAVWWESAPAAAAEGLPVVASANLEGKELRLGTAAAPVWNVLTTCSSNGSANSALSSQNPLTSLVPLAGMWFNVTFGGIGSGFLGLFAYVIVAVFISGLMVGRTPEYLGRKVETGEMKRAILILLLHPFSILVVTALFCLVPAWGRASALNAGFHGFTEILYEITSASANNGSGFGGLRDNTVAWNLATGLVMLVGRYVPIGLSLAIAGGLAAKTAVPDSKGTLRTDTVLFGVVLAAIVLFVGALLFLPVAVLGPLAEHLTVAWR